MTICPLIYIFLFLREKYHVARIVWNLNTEFFLNFHVTKRIYIANLTAQSFKVFTANKKATCACSVFISAPLSLLFRSLCGTGPDKEK